MAIVNLDSSLEIKTTFMSISRQEHFNTPSSQCLAISKGHGRPGLGNMLDGGLFAEGEGAATRPEVYSLPDNKKYKSMFVLEAGKS